VARQVALRLTMFLRRSAPNPPYIGDRYRLPVNTGFLFPRNAFTPSA
jgi:hypothetical protein